MKVKPVKARGHSRAARAGSFGVMLAVGALLVAVSVPANALLSDASSLVVTTAAERPAQTVEVASDAEVAAPVRDGYSVTSYAELLRAQYGNSAGAFTATTGAIRWPFPYSVPITDGFGQRPAWVSGQAQHNGVDFTPGGGTPIYAIADGVVSMHIEESGGLGNHVMIQHNIPGQNVESEYAHMQYGSSPLVVGEAIKVGDFIGLVGDTGNSYGAHLHFELHIDKVPVDPYAWLQANAVN
jgi:murein DD-endopeptidase MepM/ murein hydrolase activator NlpD